MKDFEGTEELYLYFKEREHTRQEEEKAKLAATKIQVSMASEKMFHGEANIFCIFQANFRGYRVRRNLGKPLPKEVSQEKVGKKHQIGNLV